MPHFPVCFLSSCLAGVMICISGYSGVEDEKLNVMLLFIHDMKDNTGNMNEGCWGGEIVEKPTFSNSDHRINSTSYAM